MLKADPRIETAIAALVSARQGFEIAASEGLILGNDNHIGDVGEYWVRSYFESIGKFQCFASAKNSNYDLQLTDGIRVSVKTLTAWSKNGYGTQIKPLCGNNWQLLAAVLLDRSLQPAKIALVPLAELLTKTVFLNNETRRSNKGTRTYPRFQWWPWLEHHVVYSHV